MSPKNFASAMPTINRINRGRPLKIQLFAIVIVISGCASAPSKSTVEQGRTEVETAERAFAKTMADRNFTAFQRFLADDSIFFGDAKPLRGKAQIAADWKKYFDSAAAPFSWEPADVEVLDTGTLALSTGPVRDAKGKCFATYNSIWRKESAGIWRVVFDKGSPGCDSP
jgi:ketosteroid isomerase-like protein